MKVLATGLLIALFLVCLFEFAGLVLVTVPALCMLTGAGLLYAIARFITDKRG